MSHDVINNIFGNEIVLMCLLIVVNIGRQQCITLCCNEWSYRDCQNVAARY